MKKMYFLMSLLALGATAHAQIVTVSGASNTILNNTYPLCNSGFPCTTAEAKDAGTDSYVVDVPASGFPLNKYQIYRNAGTWKFARVYLCSGCTSPSFQFFDTVVSNTTKPPCNWGNGITLTGDCVTPAPTSVKATTILPTVVSVPQLIATDIAAIASPQKGMLVYDLTNNCLKVYNGTLWKCLAEQ
jgi:hypothetical protein